MAHFIECGPQVRLNEVFEPLNLSLHSHNSKSALRIVPEAEVNSPSIHSIYINHFRLWGTCCFKREESTSTRRVSYARSGAVRSVIQAVCREEIKLGGRVGEGHGSRFMSVSIFVVTR
jgi:hypothetical protein